MLEAEAQAGGGGLGGRGGLGVLHFCGIINLFLLFYNGQLIIMELKNTIFMQNFN